MFCRCLHYFDSTEKLEIHIIDCREMNDCAILLSARTTNGSVLTNHGRKERLPFVVYADLECVLKKTEDSRKDAKNRKLCTYQLHKVHYMHCSYEASLSAYRYQRDVDCVSWFLNELKIFAHFAKPILANNVPLKS